MFADHLPGDETGDLVASRVRGGVAAISAFYYSSVIGDFYHSLFECMAPGMAENEARFISRVIVMLYIRDRFIHHHFADRDGRPGGGFRKGDGRELSWGRASMS